jgi:hypothetical protein
MLKGLMTMAQISQAQGMARRCSEANYKDCE